MFLIGTLYLLAGGVDLMGRRGIDLGRASGLSLLARLGKFNGRPAV